MNNFISMSNLGKNKQINFKEISIMKQTFLVLILVASSMLNLQAQTPIVPEKEVTLAIHAIEIKAPQNVNLYDMEITAAIIEKAWRGKMGNLRNSGVKVLTRSSDNAFKNERNYYNGGDYKDDRSSKEKKESGLLRANYIFESYIYVYSDSSIRFIANIVDFETGEEVAYVGSERIYDSEHQILIDTADELVGELSSNFIRFLEKKR